MTQTKYITDGNINDYLTAGGLTDVTYTELTTLISTSGLTAGGLYRITDFNTRHYIVDGDLNRYFGEGNEVTGELEPLIVQAISTNNIDKEAKSTLYPQDIIYYDWNPNNWLNDLSFADAENEETAHTIISGFTGIIYFRHDTLLDNYMGYDFRNCKFRRWKIQADDYVAGTVYVKTNVVRYLGFIYIALTTTFAYFDATQWIKSINETYNQHWFVSPVKFSDWSSDNTFYSSTEYADFKTFSPVIGEFMNTYELCCQSNHFESFKADNINWFANASILMNNVFFLKYDEYYSLYINSNTFGVGCCNNTFYGDVADNIIGNSFMRNIIQDGFYVNVISNSFSRNILNVAFNYNIIGASCSNNIFENNILFNTIGNSFQNNFIHLQFNSNNIGRSFRTNNVGMSMFSNKIGTSCELNTIAMSCQYNQLDDGSSSNIIGNNFKYNTGIMISIDFTLASHVYQGYSCTLFKRQDLTYKLRYFDNSDVQIIVNANA